MGKESFGFFPSERPLKGMSTLQKVSLQPEELRVESHDEEPTPRRQDFEREQPQALLAGLDP